MSGMETAVLGSVVSQVSKAALNWLQSQGTEISEEEWQQVGYQIGIEIQSLASQSQRNPGQTKTLKKELNNAAKTYQKLGIVGRDLKFDQEIISQYTTLAEFCDEWSVELNYNTPIEEQKEKFEELHDEYKEMAI